MLAVAQNSTFEATANVVSLKLSDDAYGIDEVEVENGVVDAAIYTIDGKRVNSMEAGQVYIINNQKVMIKK